MANRVRPPTPRLGHHPMALVSVGRFAYAAVAVVLVLVLGALVIGIAVLQNRGRIDAVCKAQNEDRAIMRQILSLSANSPNVTPEGRARLDQMIALAAPKDCSRP